MSKYCIVAAALMAVALAGCDKTVQMAPEPRLVRTVTVEHGAEGEIVSLTGHVRPKDQASLAFRLDGRMIERPVNVGDVLKAGQVVAKLDPQIPDNALRSAEANLTSLEATLTQARLTFGRQQQLLKDGWTPRANFDEAQQKLLTAQSPGRRCSGAGPDRAGTAGLYGLVRRRAGLSHRSRRRAGRGGSRRADGRAARTSGRTRRRLRRPRATHPQWPARSRGRDCPQQRPAGEGDRPSAGGCSAGGFRDPYISSQGRHRRPAGFDEAWRHCRWPHQAVRRHPASRCRRAR